MQVASKKIFNREETMELTDEQWKKYFEFAQKKAIKFGAHGEMVLDMAATAMEKLVKKEKSSEDNIEAWLTTVVRNQMIDLGKKKTSKGKSKLSFKGYIDGFVDQLSAFMVRSHGSMIASQLDAKADAEKILQKLSEKDQRLLMSHFAGKSNKDIAKEMGYASDKVVATRIKQLIKKIQAENIN